jgi:hypothetical protein
MRDVTVASVGPLDLLVCLCLEGRKQVAEALPSMRATYANVRAAAFGGTIAKQPDVQ